MKKRVLSLMLATVMCMALAVTANAVEYDSSIEQTSLINGNFPKNVRGETYGTALMAEVVGEMPDLQAAIGTNDLCHNGPLRHAKAEGRLPLSGVHCLNARPDDLRDVGAGIHHQCA